MAGNGAGISAVRGCAANGTDTEKREPRPGLELQFDPVAEQAAQPVDDCETQAETTAAVRRKARELVELAEYTLPLVCRNAGPGIADIDAQLRPAVAAADHHAAALRVAHRIGHEIEHNALEQDGIARYPGVARDHA